MLLLLDIRLSEADIEPETSDTSIPRESPNVKFNSTSVSTFYDFS